MVVDLRLRLWRRRSHRPLVSQLRIQREDRIDLHLETMRKALGSRNLQPCSRRDPLINLLSLRTKVYISRT